MPALHPLMCDTTSWRTPDDGENTLRSLLYPARFAQKGDTATLFPRPLMEKPGGCIDFFEGEASKQRKQSTERLAVPKVQPAKHLSDLSFTDVRSSNGHTATRLDTHVDGSVRGPFLW